MDADKLGYLDAARFKHGAFVRGGRYSRRPDRVRQEFGTRWLSTDYRLGDVIIFNTRGLHATLDNRSKGFRISIDIDIQPMRDATDPRFEGPRPIVHGARDVNIFDHAKQVTDEVRRYSRSATWSARGAGHATGIGEIGLPVLLSVFPSLLRDARTAARRCSRQPLQRIGGRHQSPRQRQRQRGQRHPAGDQPGLHPSTSKSSG